MPFGIRQKDNLVTCEAFMIVDFADQTVHWVILTSTVLLVLMFSFFDQRMNSISTVPPGLPVPDDTLADRRKGAPQDSVSQLFS